MTTRKTVAHSKNVVIYTRNHRIALVAMDRTHHKFLFGSHVLYSNHIDSTVYFLLLYINVIEYGVCYESWIVPFLAS